MSCYAAIHDSVPLDPKLTKLSDAAFRVWVYGLVYIQKHATDGFIPSEVVGVLGSPIPRGETVLELVNGRVWDTVDGGYKSHNYLEWNDSAAKRAQKRLENQGKQNRFRDRARAEKQAPARVDPATETDVDVTTPNTPKATASSPVPPAFDRPAPRGNGAIIQSPLAHERLKASLGYLGARFRVPKTFHEELVSRYGGDEQVARDALEVWYRGLDEAMGPDESIPDIYKFINGHFAVLVASRSAPVPVPRKKDDQRQAATDPAWRKQFDEAAKRKAEAK